VNRQLIFSGSLLFINVLATLAQLYVIKVVKYDKDYAQGHNLNGYYRRYTQTTWVSVLLGLGAIICFDLIFLSSIIENPADRPITYFQLLRALLFLGIDAFIVGRSFYVAKRYHEDVNP